MIKYITTNCFVSKSLKALVFMKLLIAVTWREMKRKKMLVFRVKAFFPSFQNMKVKRLRAIFWFCGYKKSCFENYMCWSKSIRENAYFIFSSFFSLMHLFSVLKTFLHDPLVEWSKPVKGNTKAQVNETGEVVNEKVSSKQA